MSTREWKGTPSTFRAVTHVLGRVYVVCWPCKRYLPLYMTPKIAERDSRRTTFSCSRCGAEANQTFDDPGKIEGMTADVRNGPVPRHPEATARLAGRRGRGYASFSLSFSRNATFIRSSIDGTRPGLVR